MQERGLGCCAVCAAVHAFLVSYTGGGGGPPPAGAFFELSGWPFKPPLPFSLLALWGLAVGVEIASTTLPTGTALGPLPATLPFLGSVGPGCPFFPFSFSCWRLEPLLAGKESASRGLAGCGPLRLRQSCQPLESSAVPSLMVPPGLVLSLASGASLGAAPSLVPSSSSAWLLPSIGAGTASAS